MRNTANTWALVLAAGEGTRLRSLTTAASGASVPKQYCSLYDGPSLVQDALARAAAVADPDRTCVVVARQHRRWWQPALAALPSSSLIVQPANRGTGHGILLPLLHIARRDPEAKVLVLPSDHYVGREHMLARALRAAVAPLQRRPHEAVLLGLEPEEPDPELGYIVPGADDGQQTRPVRQFVEKPAPRIAQRLLAEGALWNAFIIAASVRALLGMFRRRVPGAFAAMQDALHRDLLPGGSQVETVYERLPMLDFSRDVLSGETAHLRVLPVAACGWTDLGTPRRVAAVLQNRAPEPVTGTYPCLSLAAQHALQRAC